MKNNISPTLEKYKNKVKLSARFNKSLKKVLKQGKNIDKLLDVVDILANGEELPYKYHNHRLVNDNLYVNCYECHIEPDWLLIYRYNYDELVLVLVNTGSHNHLFKNYSLSY